MALKGSATQALLWTLVDLKQKPGSTGFTLLLFCLFGGSCCEGLGFRVVTSEDEIDNTSCVYLSYLCLRTLFEQLLMLHLGRKKHALKFYFIQSGKQNSSCLSKGYKGDSPLKAPPFGKIIFNFFQASWPFANPRSLASKAHTIFENHLRKWSREIWRINWCVYFVEVKTYLKKDPSFKWHVHYWFDLTERQQQNARNVGTCANTKQNSFFFLSGGFPKSIFFFQSCLFCGGTWVSGIFRHFF